MRVYFTTALRGKKTYKKNYEVIAKYLKEFGYGFETCDIFIEGIEERVSKQTVDDNILAYKRLARRLKNADVVVAEVSAPSTALGHEISEALFLDKPVIALHTHEGNKPALLEGYNSEKLQMIEYDLNSLKVLLKQAMAEAQELLDVRFNFNINPKLLDYLNWIAKEEETTRSGYLRELIKREMENNKKYNKK